MRSEHEANRALAAAVNRATLRPTWAHAAPTRTPRPRAARQTLGAALLGLLIGAPAVLVVWLT